MKVLSFQNYETATIKYRPDPSQIIAVKTQDHIYLSQLWHYIITYQKILFKNEKLQ